VPQSVDSTPSQVTASAAAATQSLEELTELAALGQTSEVRDAATTLHSQLMALLAQAGTDPEAARQGLLLLSAERDAIAQSGDSQALGDVLAASTHLTNLILQALPASVRTTAPKHQVIVVVATTAPPRQPAPKPSSSSSAAPKPSSSPTPSSSPSSDPGVLPTDAPVHP